MIPKHYRIEFTKEQIADQVAKMAHTIDEWIDQEMKRSNQDVLAIPLLHGGIFFYADLSRQVTRSLSLFPVKASAYSGNQAASELKIDFDFNQVKGRSVLLVDEICESGRSLHGVTERCIAAGATSVAQAVLILRDGAGTFEPTFVGYRYKGPEWFVGYGMDDNGRFRNLPDIYVIENH